MLMKKVWDKGKRRVCAKKEKGVSIVKGREGKDIQVHQRKIKKKIY